MSEPTTQFDRELAAWQPLSTMLRAMDVTKYALVAVSPDSDCAPWGANWYQTTPSERAEMVRKLRQIADDIERSPF